MTNDDEKALHESYSLTWKDDPKWISVKNTLPSDQNDVLVYDGTYFAIDRMIFWTHKPPSWLRGEHITELITHWMPLPEPPNEP